MRFFDMPLWETRVFIAIFGLLWGSFLNVVIYRLPLGMSVVRPPSHCPACETPIRAWQNVPFFGWIFLGGKAACCKVKIPVRYPLVELLGGIAAVAVLEMQRASHPELSLGVGIAVFLANYFLVLGLIAGVFIDLEHMILPNEITMGGAVLAMATTTLRGQSFTDAAIGAVTGFLIIYVPMVLYKWIRGREGLGWGDAKLLVLVGAWVGIEGVMFTLFAGAVQGTLFALVTMLVMGKIEEPESVKQQRAELQALADAGDEEAREELEGDPVGQEPADGFMRAPIAFGPMLILGAFEYFFFGKVLVKACMDFLDATIGSVFGF
ncbi:MAG: prepilin peptidase [Polyangiaceae bacterium]|nr:prepilin peptidase [Polyangiaceae bacterium]